MKQLCDQVEGLKCVPSHIYELHDARHTATWFKAEDKEYVHAVLELASLARKYGYKIRILRTRDPGEIVYEDDWQVVALNEGVKAFVNSPALPKRWHRPSKRRDRATIRRIAGLC